MSDAVLAYLLIGCLAALLTDPAYRWLWPAAVAALGRER